MAGLGGNNSKDNDISGNDIGKSENIQPQPSASDSAEGNDSLNNNVNSKNNQSNGDINGDTLGTTEKSSVNDMPTDK